MKGSTYAFMSTDGYGHLHLRLLVVPNARQTAIDGLHGEAGQQALKIRLQAPPVDGQANVALIKWMAKLLGLHQSDLHIQRGHGSRLKQLRLNPQAADRANWQALQEAIEH
jgi:uncharacterized protein